MLRLNLCKLIQVNRFDSAYGMITIGLHCVMKLNVIVEIVEIETGN